RPDRRHSLRGAAARCRRGARRRVSSLLRTQGIEKLWHSPPHRGRVPAGRAGVLIDDVITDGGAKLEAAQPFREAGLLAEDVLVLVDREQGGAEQLAHAGLRLHACYTLRRLLGHLEQGGQISPDTWERVDRYLETG